MVGIASLGVGSGLDLKGLIDKLVAAEAQGPTRALNSKEQRLTLDLSGYGLLSSALADFQAALKKISDPGAFQAIGASLSDPDAGTVTVDDTAVPGTYTVDVLTPLSKEVWQSADLQRSELLSLIPLGEAGPTDGFGIGDLTLTRPGDGASFTVTVGDSGLLPLPPLPGDYASAEDIVQAINDASDNFGVTASIQGDTTIVFESDQAGASFAFTVGVTDADGNDTDALGLSQLAIDNMTRVQEASDLKVQVTYPNGTTEIFTEYPLTFDGITVDAEQVAAGPATLTVSDTTGNSRGEIREFVDAFNRLQDAIDELGFADIAGDNDGLLVGDSILRGVESQLRRAVFTDVGGQPAELRFLSYAGIGYDDQGKLQIDDDKLQNAIDNNFDALASLFQKEGGLVDQFNGVVDGYIGSGGVLPSRTDSLNRQIADISDDRDVLARRLENLEARLVTKFSGLDTLISQLNSTGNYLNQQLLNINNIVSNPVKRAGN